MGRESRVTRTEKKSAPRLAGREVKIWTTEELRTAVVHGKFPEAKQPTLEIS